MKTIKNVQNLFRGRILIKFKIQSFLFSELCLKSNDFVDCEFVLDQNDKFAHFNTF